MILCAKSPATFRSVSRIGHWTPGKIVTHLVSSQNSTLNKYPAQFYSPCFPLQSQLRFYSMTNNPRILTVGTGAIGAIYSWRLSKTCDITAVCRSNYDAVKNSGLNIESAKFGNEVFKPTEVVRKPEEAVSEDKPFDYILVTLKALPEVYNVADIIAPAVSKNTAIVLIQNGLGVEEPIVERFPDNPIISIVAYIGTSQTEPGTIKMVGRESLLTGPYLGSKVDSEKERDAFIGYLREGGVDVNVVEDVERIRWQKLFWNASFSPVCTLTGLNTSEVLRNEDAMATAKHVMSEVIQASNAYGHGFDLEEQMHAMISRTEATATNYKPSMQLDYERGNPMEIEVILGVPMKKAQAKGVSVPHLETVYHVCSAANARIINKGKSSL